MKQIILNTLILVVVASAFIGLPAGIQPAFAQAGKSRIVHDAEYYILDAQHGQKWAVEDKELDKKLAELRKKFGTPPNIIHLMWDDQPMGAVGIPALQQIRGYSTPKLNQMAAEGMLFTRMYTEPSCTPSRAAAVTGQHPVRNGMFAVGFPIEYKGLSKNSVTIAHALSKAGYATAFYGKWHLGDIEESYPYNQGYDEALFALYNQVASLMNLRGEAVNAVLGLKEELLAKDRYQLDNKFNQKGYVFYIEGKKGEQGKEWGATQTPEDYAALDVESEKRALAFMRQSATAKKPFYVAWWPLWTSFIPDPKKVSLQRGLVGEAYEKALDPMAGRLMEFLKAQGLAENTLIVAMSDNGPMTHNPPAGAGLGEGLFRGGKGDSTEGGVRVSAQAWWPGVIKPGQTVGDIIHITDLYTTFARLGGAMQYLPTDRVIDGIDQTALLLKGDSFSRRDYVFIYLGPTLAASVKKQYKRAWIGGHGAASGAAAFYDLYNDTREQTPLLIQMLHFKEPFNRMRARHELWKKKYPDQPAGFGRAFTGLTNARAETIALSRPPVDLKSLPFDVLQYIEHMDRLPFDPHAEPDLGR
ncbi:MAG: sulfatase-like hydrolase/transferase [Candidatus Methylomirabilales bacterium]